MTDDPKLRMQRREELRGLAARHGSKLPWDAKFTCDECPSAMECRYAWDDYNTQNDCLAVK